MQQFIVLIILWISLSVVKNTYCQTHSELDLLHSGNNLRNLQWTYTGGLNACQFCSIDLNLDGIADLLIFDRHGNRKLTFISSEAPGASGYSFAPEYALKMPDLHDWVITADYNCDGKMDIFTYSAGGVRVFKNISDTTLKFEIVTDLLESWYYNGYVGILVTSVDYPAIADIDGDGDLDLLTFFGLGSYVEYHKNFSMEKYGNCDRLDYKLSDHCWGRFSESESGNRIVLNAVCPTQKKPFLRENNPRHTGSTLLATDLNNDGLKDLILGDYDYPGLIALYNGGTVDSALMVSQDTAFPAGTKPVKLFSFPSVSLIDIDRDGLKDLVVSPFDPGLYTSDNYNCVWFYRNTGTANQPVFEFSSDRLFRDQTLDFGTAAHPVLYDFDNDGLQDLFVGNDGYYDSSWYYNGQLKSQYTGRISWFKNTGTQSNPVFSNVTDDFANISNLGLRGIYPTFADVNNDGITDLVIGCNDGTLILFPQKPSSGIIPQFYTPVKNWQNIDVGDYSAPQFFDIDRDQIPELIVGERNGNLNYYKNQGSVSSVKFDLVTDSLGKINVTNYNLSYYGFSVPCFHRDNDGSTFLLVGSDEGRIHLFRNIDNNLKGKFEAIDSLYRWIAANPADTLFGWQTSPAIGHLTDKTEFDMITGNFSGGLNYVSKRPQAIIIPGLKELPARINPSFILYPNPANRNATIVYPGNFTENSTEYSYGYIYNIFGKLILKFPITGKSEISTSDFPEGIYIIRCAGKTTRMVVIHQ